MNKAFLLFYFLFSLSLNAQTKKRSLSKMQHLSKKDLLTEISRYLDKSITVKSLYQGARKRKWSPVFMCPEYIDNPTYTDDITKIPQTSQSKVVIDTLNSVISFPFVCNLGCGRASGEYIQLTFNLKDINTPYWFNCEYDSFYWNLPYHCDRKIPKPGCEIEKDIIGLRIISSRKTIEVMRTYRDGYAGGILGYESSNSFYSIDLEFSTDIITSNDKRRIIYLF